MPTCPKCNQSISVKDLLDFARNSTQVVCGSCGERLISELPLSTQLKSLAITLILSLVWVAASFNIYLLIALLAWLATLPLLQYQFVELTRGRLGPKPDPTDSTAETGNVS